MTALRLAHLEVEAAQERLPQPVHLSGRGAGAGAPQPHGLGVAIAGQVIDLEADQRAVDDGQVAVVVEPGGAVGEPGVQPVPGVRHGGAVPGGLGAGGHRRGGPARRVSELEVRPVPGRPARARPPLRREAQDPVAAQPAQHLHRQVSEPAGQPHGVIPGVEDHQDGRITLAPVPGSDQPGYDVADLRGGDLGLIVIGPEAHGVQHRGPRRAARFQGRTTEYGQPGIICACPLPRP